VDVNNFIPEAQILDRLERLTVAAARIEKSSDGYKLPQMNAKLASLFIETGEFDRATRAILSGEHHVRRHDLCEFVEKSPPSEKTKLARVKILFHKYDEAEALLIG